MLHPEYFTSEALAAVPIPARLTFAGTWVYVDDHGRGKDSAALVKAAVWPLDDDVTRHDVEGHLSALAERGLLCRYEVDGARLLHVVSWHEHQKVSHPTPTKLPPCPHHEPPVEGGGTTAPGPVEPDASGPAERPERGSSRARRGRSGVSPEVLASGSGEARETPGETLHSVVQSSSVQFSSSKGAAAAASSPQTPVDDLRARLLDAGLLARWDRMGDDELAEVAELLDVHGPVPLVRSAQREHRKDKPAAFAQAWLAGWRSLPRSRLRVVAEACDRHPGAGVRPGEGCAACMTERRAADVAPVELVGPLAEVPRRGALRGSGGARGALTGS